MRGLHFSLLNSKGSRVTSREPLFFGVILRAAKPLLPATLIHLPPTCPLLRITSAQRNKPSSACSRLHAARVRGVAPAMTFALNREINMEQILINLIAGALGGAGAGKSSPTFDLDTIGNIISGLVGPDQGRRQPSRLIRLVVGLVIERRYASSH